MLSVSTCYGSRRRMSAWLPEPLWARSPWTAATASPTWTSPSASPTACRSLMCSMTGRARSWDELDAVHLADLAMTPAAQFRPAGPRFRLLFGETAAGDAEARKPPVAGELFIPTPAVAG